jgi:hypothetical protein
MQLECFYLRSFFTSLILTEWVTLRPYHMYSRWLDNRKFARGKQTSH